MNKWFAVLFLTLIISGCSSTTPVYGLVENEKKPQIICGEERKIIVSAEEFYFSPNISGDIDPLVNGECFFYSPKGGSLIIENWDLVFQFSNEEVINLPQESFEKGFTFYWKR